MGWLFPYCATKPGLIKQIIEPVELSNEKYFKLTRRALKHCYRGNTYRGVLWVVFEMEKLNTATSNKLVDRVICAYLLERREGSWGYKCLEEPMGPYYYSCPLGYLKLVPEDLYPANVHKDWREGVLAYHDRLLQKKKERKLCSI